MRACRHGKEAIDCEDCLGDSELSIGAINGLWRANIRTIRQLAALDRSPVRLTNIGRARCEQILRLLKKHGLNPAWLPIVPMRTVIQTEAGEWVEDHFSRAFPGEGKPEP